MLSLFAFAVSSAFFASNGNDEKRFLSFMRETSQFYTGDEYHMRFGIFLTNMRKIEEHNRGSSSYKLGINHLMALTPAEYRSLLGTRYSQMERQPFTPTKSAPESLDWRDTPDVVANIKDQGQCGSCYIFSALQAVESANKLLYGELIVLSEQNIMDCAILDPYWGCYGCNGGLKHGVCNFARDIQKGFMREDEYPYHAVVETCKFEDKKKVSWFYNFKWDKIGDEESLKELVAEWGPASVAINAGLASFQLYKEGIYDDEKCDSMTLNHGVGVVGYGSQDGKDYWIVKNSWGRAWGMEGYIFMSRNKHDQCGITVDAFSCDVNKYTE